MIQENKLSKKNVLKIDGYEIFERKRNDRGGGLAIGFHESLEPYEICQSESEESEILIVEAKAGTKVIRFITAYGPQEPNSKDEKKNNWIFFNNLEQAIIKSQLIGASVIIEFDANSKLGPELLPGDPHQQSTNGSMLAGIITRQNLIIGNSLSKTTGLITRQRTTVNGEEKSVIDFLLVSSDLLEKIESVEIGDDRKYTLARFGKENGCDVVKLSDHNPIIAKFNLNVKNVKKERMEMFNLRNTECQAKFRDFTNQTDLLSNSIKLDDDIDSSFD
jgi:exonuclease III